jgi:rubrerythrin
MKDEQLIEGSAYICPGCDVVEFDEFAAMDICARCGARTVQVPATLTLHWKLKKIISLLFAFFHVFRTLDTIPQMHCPHCKEPLGYKQELPNFVKCPQCHQYGRQRYLSPDIFIQDERPIFRPMTPHTCPICAFTTFSRTINGIEHFLCKNKNCAWGKNYPKDDDIDENLITFIELLSKIK